MQTERQPAPFTRRRFVGLTLAAFGGALTLPELLRGVPAAGAAVATQFVAVVGDSLTVGTKPYQEDDLLAAGWQRATVNGYGSRGIATKVDTDPYTGLTAVDAIRSGGAEPDLWIVALGTNDAGLGPASGYPALIARMLDRVGDRPVLWVNIHLPRSSSRQAAWNAALEAAAADASRTMRVYDWASLAAANTGWLTSDGVHYTGAGYQRRSTAIAQASTTAATAMVIAEPSVAVASSPVAVAAGGAPARLVPFTTPMRALDTRLGGGTFATGETRTIDLSGVLPDGATSVVINITAAEAAGEGYVTAWDAGRSQPDTSNLNLSPTRTVATHTICGCASGRLAITASAATHLIVDVQAAFVDATVTTDGLGLRQISPTRLYDSRAGGGTLSPGSARTITVPEFGGRRPQAAIVGLTMTDVAAAGYATLWPGGLTQPSTSDLNIGPGDGAVVNTAHVRLNDLGELEVATTADAAVIVDLLAVYDDGDDTLLFQAAEPARVLDTRLGVGGWQGAPAADQTIDVAVIAPGSVLVAGVVATAAVADGYVVAWSGEGDAPANSTLNLATDEVRSVWAPMTRSTAGTVRLDTVGGGAADLVLDVVGWYAARD